MMDTALRALLAELEEAGLLNDAREQDRGKKMLNLESDSAQLLSGMPRRGGREVGRRPVL